MKKAGRLAVLWIYYFTCTFILMNVNQIRSSQIEKDKLNNNKNEILKLSQELTIGDKNISSENEIMSISSIGVDDKGNVYVVDPKASDIKVFDISGKYLNKIGRRGQGPGELEVPVRIRIFRNEYIVVFSLGRMTKYDLSGKYIKYYSTPGKIMIRRPKSIRKGILLGEDMKGEKNIMNFLQNTIVN